MKILVTNDDGVRSEGLWTLVRELAKTAQVTVVAPDRERSAIGTAVTLFQPLHVIEAESPVAGVKAYAIDGTPSDCVILGHGKLVRDIDMVVSGINPGPNFGEDVYISGTVGAAMQAYTRGLPALAVSATYPRDSVPGPGVLLPVSKHAIDAGAWAAAALVRRLSGEDCRRLFLNMNIPDLPLEKIESVRLTRLARSSHINTVTEDNRGPVKQYRMVRERIAGSDIEGTDIHAVMNGRISVTPLYTSLFDKPPQRLLNRLCHELNHELAKMKRTA